ncbi:MAG TPA: ClpXP protease specificity-enhancing factor SspB [Acetobacteraceae bacterium]|nr:ClpXP protease specificity-enhancing factor SspB [Acetobacteraceae bacterium]
MEDNSNGAPPQRPESLLPYDLWTENALRQVVVMALDHVVQHGLPGEHHFYVTFRTDQDGVVVPQRLLAKYPHEMTIVLQNQFWDLKVDEAARQFSVGLSFGGVPATVVIPFAAITGFADPHVQFGLRFSPAEEAPPEEAAAEDAQATVEEPSAEPAPPPSTEPQVVSLDAFRKRPPSKDQ